MVQILAGEKGEGKTKRLIAMANEASATAEGCIVFVDDDNSRMYDLNHKVRFVDTPKFIMDDPDIFRVFSDRRDVKNEAPILIYKRKLKGKDITVREFYTTIPMERWQQKREAIADIMDICILGEMEYSKNNGNKIVIKSVAHWYESQKYYCRVLGAVTFEQK